MQRQTAVHDQVPLQTKLLLSVEAAAMVLSLGRTVLYDLLMRHEIASVKVGRTRRIMMSVDV